MKNKEKKEIYEWCINEGLNLSYGKLSLCDLRNFRHSMIYDNRKYQVHCDDPKYLWSKIYDELEPAINKFMEIKMRIKKKQ